MEARLVELGALLRQNGLRISVAELGDAARALEHCGLEDKETVHAALRATLCKRSRDRETFDRVFELYVSGAQRSMQEMDEALLRRIDEEGVLEGDDLEMLLYTLREMGQRLSPLSRAILDGDGMGIARQLRGAALQLDFGEISEQAERFYTRQLLRGAGAQKVREEWEAIEAELRKQGLDAARVEMLGGRLAERLRLVEALARNYVQEQARMRGEAARAGDGWQHLDPEAIARLEQAVARLASRLESRVRRRERSRRRGTLNALATLRQNLALGGLPARLQFRRRRVEKAELVVLCDLSDSVRDVSRLMLHFLYALQRQFSKMRSFVFVADVREVTGAFERMGAAEAIEWVASGGAVERHGNSNYGRALSRFASEHLGAVGRRTTVLIIGDGRNNYQPTHPWALQEVARKARRVIWICPEDRDAWLHGDSEMLLYERLVQQVIVARSLRDLENLARQLLP